MWIFGLLLLLLYIYLVILFFALVGPWIVVLSALGAFGFVLYHYQRVLYGVMVEVGYTDPAVLKFPPPTGDSDDTQPAYRQYFFGQALEDLQHTVKRSWSLIVTGVTDIEADLRRVTFGDAVLFTWPLGIVGYIGFVAGCVAGGVGLGIVVALHAGSVLIAQAVAMATAWALQKADLGVRRVRKIEVTCPECHRGIEFPSYRCPNAQCTARHSDIRPGKFGVLRRTCRCKTRFPTLIMLGSDRLDAYCPNPSCKTNLADRVGTAREIIMPVLGPTAAGKTRLMATIIASFEHKFGSSSGFSFADQSTRQEFDRLRKLLLAGDQTRATQVQLPRGYSVYVGQPGSSRRLVHLFDPAGEMQVETARMVEQSGYLKRAKLFTFVLDLVTNDAFWSGLDPVKKDSLSVERAAATSIRSADVVLANAVDSLNRIGVNTNDCRLAVCFSKADLLGIRSHQQWGKARIENWMTAELGLGNMCRSLSANFGSVEYFFVASVASESEPDSSLRPYLNWLLEEHTIVL